MLVSLVWVKLTPGRVNTTFSFMFVECIVRPYLVQLVTSRIGIYISNSKIGITYSDSRR